MTLEGLKRVWENLRIAVLWAKFWTQKLQNTKQKFLISVTLGIFLSREYNIEFFYTILKGVGELCNSLLFSILTHHIRFPYGRLSIFSFFDVLQESYRHDNLMGNSSTCFQSTLKSCIILAVLQQWHPVLSSFQRCVTWSDWAADHSLGK